MDFVKIITARFYGKHPTKPVVWTAEIWRRGATPGAVLEVEVDDDAPCIIEWAEDDLWAPIHSSTCTLKLISPGDRSLTELYSVPPAEVQLRVYRGTALWWEGTLDPEFYEEPYDNRLKDYTVSLTFSDFGILNRISVDWPRTGRKTLRTIITDALNRAAMGDLSLSLGNAISSTYYNGLTTDVSEMKLHPEYIAARCANFYDEDGEPTNFKEALAAILQPLAMRIEQRGGTVRLYDINARATRSVGALTPVEVNNGTLSAGKTANRIEVSFSPYDEADLYNGTIDPDGLFSDTDDITKAKYNLDYNWADPVPGFTLGTGMPADVSSLPLRLNTTAAKARYFKIDPAHSGSPCAGIAYSWPLVSSAESNFQYTRGGEAPMAFRPSEIPAIGDVQMRLIKCPGVQVPAADGGNSRKLRISLDICVDCRYNFYESADEFNEEGAAGRCSEEINLLYIPVRLYLLNVSGVVTHYYENTETLSGSGYLQDNGRWVESPTHDAPWGKMFFAYYGADLQKKTSGVQCGWSTNRPYVPAGAMPKFKAYKGKSFKARGDGEQVPLPPVDGTLVLEIGRGICFYDFDHTDHVNDADRFREINWVLYKDPYIGVINKDYTKLDPEDEIFTGEVDSDAADPVSVDTTCGGTDAVSGRVTARGVLLVQNQRTKAWQQMTTITRGPNTGRPEALLMATIASQLTPRHTVISGEIDLDPEAFTICRVQGQPASRVFTPASEIADLHALTSTVKLVEISPDEYHPEYTE